MDPQTGQWVISGMLDEVWFLIGIIAIGGLYLFWDFYRFCKGR